MWMVYGPIKGLRSPVRLFCSFTHIGVFISMHECVPVVHSTNIWQEKMSRQCENTLRYAGVNESQQDSLIFSGAILQLMHPEGFHLQDVVAPWLKVNENTITLCSERTTLPDSASQIHNNSQRSDINPLKVSTAGAFERSRLC